MCKKERNAKRCFGICWAHKKVNGYISAWLFVESLICHYWRAIVELNCTDYFVVSGVFGKHCELNSYGFEELSYMEFPSLDPNNNYIYIKFSTIKENSLLMYNYDNQTGSKAEFLALEIVEGKMKFSFNLGSGAHRLMTTKRVSDGQFHTVVARRAGLVSNKFSLPDSILTSVVPFFMSALIGLGTKGIFNLLWRMNLLCWTLLELWCVTTNGKIFPYLRLMPHIKILIRHCSVSVQ